MLDSVSKTGGYGDRSLIAGGLAPASTRVKATTAWYAVVKDRQMRQDALLLKNIEIRTKENLEI